MKKILLLYPDSLLLDFLAGYIESYGFQAFTSNYITDGIHLALKHVPDLIIANKHFKGMTAEYFLTRKNVSDKIAHIPVFLIGNFEMSEIMRLKKENVRAFISPQINPKALVERFYILFKMKAPEIDHHTPMLMDIHVKGDIFNIQIEGNLEMDKILLLNYLIRLYCKKKKVKSPSFLFIVPSLYPENITEKNMDALFAFRHAEELKLEKKAIQVLTRNSKMIHLLKSLSEPQYFNLPLDFFEAIQNLDIEIDLSTEIKLEYMKPGYTYYLDLYDLKGNLIMPANQEFSKEKLQELADKGTKSLFYKDEEAVITVAQEESPEEAQQRRYFQMKNQVAIKYLQTEFEPVATELPTLQVVDEKQSLFFSKIKGQYVLLNTVNPSIISLIKQTMGMYFHIHIAEETSDFTEKLNKRRYSLIVLDEAIKKPPVLKKMAFIRSKFSRRASSTIVMAQKIDKAELVRLKSLGVSDIVLYPFTTQQIMQKLFQVFSLDRQT